MIGFVFQRFEHGVVALQSGEGFSPTRPSSRAVLRLQLFVVQEAPIRPKRAAPKEPWLRKTVSSSKPQWAASGLRNGRFMLGASGREQ